MHKSLQIKTNVILVLFWGSLAVGLVRVPSPRPWLLVISAAVLGAIGGLLQARAIRSSAAAFHGATTLMEVRGAISSTSAGRRYLLLFWVSQLFIVSLAVWQSRANMLVSFLAAYCAFAFWREALSLPAVVAFNRRTV